MSLHRAAQLHIIMKKYSDDRTRIEINDDGNSISVEGKIIGGLEELKE